MFPVPCTIKYAQIRLNLLNRHETVIDVRRLSKYAVQCICQSGKQYYMSKRLMHEWWFPSC